MPETHTLHDAGDPQMQRHNPKLSLIALPPHVAPTPPSRLDVLSLAWPHCAPPLRLPSAVPDPPPTSPSIGPLLVTVGVIIVIIGVAVSTGLFRWFGRLPGDIRIEHDRVRIYVPLASMLLVSLLLTLIVRLFRR